MSDYSIGGVLGFVTALVCVYLPWWAAIPINLAIVFGGRFLLQEPT
jgi:hypothetical protein